MHKVVLTSRYDRHGINLPSIEENQSQHVANLAGFRAFSKGGDLNPGERHSRDTRDDGTVTLSALRSATILSRNCCTDFGRPLNKKGDVALA